MIAALYLDCLVSSHFVTEESGLAWPLSHSVRPFLGLESDLTKLLVQKVLYFVVLLLFLLHLALRLLVHKIVHALLNWLINQVDLTSISWRTSYWSAHWKISCWRRCCWGSEVEIEFTLRSTGDIQKCLIFCVRCL